VSHFKLSVIIPSWRDVDNLRILLPKLASDCEIIIVEASSDAEIERLALAHSANLLRCDTPSRGKQMNQGAARATADVLVFLHADTEIESAHFDALMSAIADSSVVGGAFCRKFDERHPHLRPLEIVARFLTRRGGTLFGDQTIFVRRDVFEKLRGFAQIPLMEDVDFSRRLRAAGRVAVLDPSIRTSPRHHLENGPWRTTIRNGLFLLLFKFGVSANVLHSIYYARRKRSSASPRLDFIPPAVAKQ
jgi:rSAM/selenodomain-associated transferase 2